MTDDQPQPSALPVIVNPSILEQRDLEDQPQQPIEEPQQLESNQDVEISEDLEPSINPSDQYDNNVIDGQVVDQLEKIAETGNVVDIRWADLQRALKTRLEQIIETYKEIAQQKQQKEEEEQQSSPKQQNQPQQQQQPHQEQPQSQSDPLPDSDGTKPDEKSSLDNQLDETSTDTQVPHQRDDSKTHSEPSLETTDQLDQDSIVENNNINISSNNNNRDSSISSLDSAERTHTKINHNDDKFDFEMSRDELFDLIASFSEPPFTIQRICELLHSPFKYYDTTSTFFRGLEKNLRVVSSSLDDAFNTRPITNNNSTEELAPVIDKQKSDDQRPEQAPIESIQQQPQEEIQQEPEQNLPQNELQEIHLKDQQEPEHEPMVETITEDVSTLTQATSSDMMLVNDDSMNIDTEDGITTTSTDDLIKDSESSPAHSSYQ